MKLVLKFAISKLSKKYSHATFWPNFQGFLENDYENRAIDTKSLKPYTTKLKIE